MACEFLSLGRQAHSFLCHPIRRRKVKLEENERKAQKAANEVDEKKGRAVAIKEAKGIASTEQKLHVEESKQTEMVDVGTVLFKEAKAMLKEAKKSKSKSKRVFRTSCSQF